MLFLAGLMGMMAIGATAFAGLSPALYESDGSGQDAHGDGDETAPQNESGSGDKASADGEGTSILDFATRPGDSAADDGDQDENPNELTDAISDVALKDDANIDSLPGDILPVDVAQTLKLSNVEPEQRVAIGTPEADDMDGTSDRDVANGYEGDDTLSGAAGDDELWGGLGDDTLNGGTGADTLHGGAGQDDATGEDGDDYIFGHGADDTLAAGAGDDSLVGGHGDDTLDGGDDDDAVHGGLGDDVLRGGAGADILFGGWGDDTLSGLEDDPATDGWDDTDVSDFLNGGGGADVIIAGAGDIVTTGDGADTVLLGEWLSMEHQAEILDFAPGEDSLVVVYDDIAGGAPDVDLSPDPDDATVQHIMLNGIQIAAINNAPGLNAGHITLVGSSMLPAGVML